MLNKIYLTVDIQLGGLTVKCRHTHSTAYTEMNYAFLFFNI